MVVGLYTIESERGEGFPLQFHTYMNDVWIGVPVIGADKKVNQELSSVFLIELGQDVFQRPCWAWAMEKEGSVRKKAFSVRIQPAVCEIWKQYCTIVCLPVVNSNGPLKHRRQHIEQRSPSSELD